MYSRLLLLAFVVAPFFMKAQTIDVSALDTLACELDIPPCHAITAFTGKGFNNLRRITFNGVDILPPASFHGLPSLEEVVFNGDNLVIGGAQFFDLPKLKRVVFNGNTFIMNGSTMVGRTPEFENFEINGLVTLSEIWDPAEAPQFKGYTGNFAMLYNGNSEMIEATPASKAGKNGNYVDAFHRQLSQVTGIFENYKNDLKLARNFMYFHPEIMEYAKAFGVDTSAYVAARNKAREDE